MSEPLSWNYGTMKHLMVYGSLSNESQIEKQEDMSQPSNTIAKVRRKGFSFSEGGIQKHNKDEQKRTRLKRRIREVKRRNFFDKRNLEC